MSGRRYPAKERMAPGGGWSPELYGRAWDGLFVGGAEYGKGVSKETEWVVPGWLPTGYLVVLGAASKAGKSSLATALAISVARGAAFAGAEVQAWSVLWCAYEESEEERMAALRPWGAVPERLLISHKVREIDTEDGLMALSNWVYRIRAGLVVIDPLYAAVAFESLNDGQKARQVLMGLKDICADTGTTILVLHHLTKARGSGPERNQIAASGQIVASASMDLHMETSAHPEGGRSIVLRGQGRGEFANGMWHLRSNGVTHYEREPLPASLGTGDHILAALRGAETPLTTVQIVEATGLHLPTVRNEITELLRDGAIVAVGREGKARTFVLGS